jgi:hypothetical protein
MIKNESTDAERWLVTAPCIYFLIQNSLAIAACRVMKYYYKQQFSVLKTMVNDANHLESAISITFYMKVTSLITTVFPCMMALWLVMCCLCWHSPIYSNSSLDKKPHIFKLIPVEEH